MPQPEPAPALHGDRADARKRHALAILFAVLSLAAGCFGIYDGVAPPPKAVRDFALVHTGAECLLDRCDPYTASALIQESQARGELKATMHDDEAVYPPSTFLLLAPLARTGWPAAGYVWDCLGVLLVALSCALLVETMQLQRYPVALVPLLAVIFGPPFESTLHTGNPTVVAAPLVVIACLLLLRRADDGGRAHDGTSETASGGRRTLLGWLLLGLTLALKPQLAIGAWLALLLRPQARRSAVKAAGSAAAVFALAVLAFRLRLGSFGFLTHMVSNNRLALQPRHPSDMSLASRAGNIFLGLQRIPYFFGAQPPWPHIFAWAVVALFVLAACLVNLRNGAWRRLVWCSVALATLLSLMPVYHGKYDRLLMLAVLPAFAELRAHGARRGILWLLAATAVFWQISDMVFDHVLGGAERWPVSPAGLIVLCGLLLWAMASRVETVTPSPLG